MYSLAMTWGEKARIESAGTTASVSNSTCADSQRYSGASRLLTIPQDLARGFVLPVSPLLYRPVEGNSAGAGAIVNAAAAVPAFIGMQYDRRFAFPGVGDIDIHLADFHAMVAPVADIGMKNHRGVGGG